MFMSARDCDVAQVCESPRVVFLSASKVLILPIITCKCIFNLFVNLFNCLMFLLVVPIPHCICIVFDRDSKSGIEYSRKE